MVGEVDGTHTGYEGNHQTGCNIDDPMPQGSNAGVLFLSFFLGNTFFEFQESSLFKPIEIFFLPERRDEPDLLNF